MLEEEFVPQRILDQVSLGKDYVRAKYGFRNHWYPVRLSAEVNEAQPIAVTLLGENILINRIDGQLFAIRDRCVHRGVPLSRKLECYTKDTVTCWYHGFTYRFSDGVLCDIAAAQSSRVIGKRRLKTFPVTEAKGLVFVFVGDEDRQPPPLSHDVPPTFLDEDMVVHGRWQVVNANWRIGAENGFDSTHIFIHKNSVLIEDADLALPLGLQPIGRRAFETVTADDGPKGVIDHFSPEHVIPVFEASIGGQPILTGATSGANIVPQDISIWLPGVLRVRPWPIRELTQFEWYVPIDGNLHIYLQTLGRRCETSAEADAFAEAFTQRWVPKALRGFNDDDIWAREATEPFYADDRGWIEERLFEPDGNIIEWRKLAAQHARGIQMPRHIDPPHRHDGTST